MSLPNYLAASPNHPLMTELKSLTYFSDPVNLSSENSREIFYKNSSLFKMSLIYDVLSYVNYSSSGLPLNTNLLTNYLPTYLTGYSNSSLVNDTELLRNQYRPMKKGVSNMIKLHATGAVAMPIETRLHLLASSKDVIHS